MGIVLVAFLAARAVIDPGRDDHVNLETDQVISQGGKPVEFIVSVSRLESYVLALDIAEFTELSPEQLAPEAEAEPAPRYPIFGIFAGCCASAGKIVARRIVASTTEIILLLIGFLPWLFFLSPWESPHPYPLPKGEGKRK